ncbi:hypothetical protein BH24ACI5_BH24ACI5_10190 [soil metagenome]
MRISTSLATRAVVIGCLTSGALATLACGDGPGVPTSPSPNAAFSSAASLPASSPIHRLLLTKTCDANFPTVPVCTVVTAQEGPLPVGATAVYDFLVLDFEKLLSAKVVITTPDGSTAGHCTLSFKTGLGTCTFARGTGELAGFHANVNVTFDFATGITTWDGTYHFSGRD